MAKKSTADMVEGPSADTERKWEAEDALRTLTRAEEIQRDASLMTRVEKMRDEKIRDLKNVKIKVETSPQTMKKGK